MELEGDGNENVVGVRVRKRGTCFRDTQAGGKGAGGRSHIGHMMACFMDLKRAQGSSKCKTHWPVTLSLLSPG